MAYVFKTNIANKNNYGDKRELSAIKYIVIHYTANDGDTDENNGLYFKNNVVTASAHYFVDDDSVTQSVPDNYVAWSVGGNKYANCATTGGGKLYGKATNHNTISIEICDDIKNGVVYPSAKTIENTIELTKKKMKEYNIPQQNVIRHFDVNGKGCPAYWCGTSEKETRWKTEFWNKLSTQTTTTQTSSSTSTKTTLLVKVDKVSKGDVLNIRKEPNANSAITGKLAYNDPNTYTITEVKNGWGKLKSGVGWINLAYTKTVSNTKTSSATTTTTTTKKPTTTTTKPTETKPKVIYQVYANGKWWSEITGYNTTNSSGYAGVMGKEISGIRVKLSNGKTVRVRSHLKGKARGNWLSEITKWDNTSMGYSGSYGKPIDCVAMKADNYTLKYRVHIKGGNWLDWVAKYDIANYNSGLAGAYGKAIDAIQIDVV